MRRMQGMFVLLLPLTTAVYTSRKKHAWVSVNLEEWEGEMEDLDKEGVRTHLLRWTSIISSNQYFQRFYGNGWNATAFEMVAESLYASNVNGPGLAFLRKQFLAGNNVPLLSQIASDCGALWQFLSLLDKMPVATQYGGPIWKDPEWFEPWEYFGIPEKAWVLPATALYVVVELFFFSRLIFGFWKYKSKYDEAVPGNQTKRNKNHVKCLLPGAILSGPLSGLKDLKWQHMIDGWLWGFFVVIFFTNIIIVIEGSEALSRDLLEHATAERVQDCLKSSWTNTALLSALMFTIVVSYGMPFDGEKQLSEFPGGQRVLSTMGVIETGHIYMIFTFSLLISFAEYFVSMTTATIHLLYTDGLSAQHAAEYFVDNPRSPAEPLIWFATAAIWHLIATAILFQSTFPEKGWTFIPFFCPGVYWLYLVLKTASAWKPTPVDQIDEKKLANLPQSIRATIMGQDATAAKTEALKEDDNGVESSDVYVETPGKLKRRYIVA